MTTARILHQHALLARKDDPKAVDELIRTIAPWVRAYVRRAAHGRNDADQADMCGEAFKMILKHAIPKWSPEGGASFASYATYWMNRAIQHWYEDCALVVHVPSRLQRKGGWQARMSEVNPASLDAAVLYPVKYGKRMVSIDAPWANSGATTWKDRIVDETPLADEQMVATERVPTLRRAMKKLPKREAAILRARAADETLDSIGKRLGVSRERVRQLQERALNRLAVHMGRESAAQSL